MASSLVSSSHAEYDPRDGYDERDMYERFRKVRRGGVARRVNMQFVPRDDDSLSPQQRAFQNNTLESHAKRRRIAVADMNPAECAKVVGDALLALPRDYADDIRWVNYTGERKDTYDEHFCVELHRITRTLAEWDVKLAEVLRPIWGTSAPKLSAESLVELMKNESGAYSRQLGSYDGNPQRVPEPFSTKAFPLSQIVSFVLSKLRAPEFGGVKPLPPSLEQYDSEIIHLAAMYDALELALVKKPVIGQLNQGITPFTSPEIRLWVSTHIDKARARYDLFKTRLEAMRDDVGGRRNLWDVVNKADGEWTRYQKRKATYEKDVETYENAKRAHYAAYDKLRDEFLYSLFKDYLSQDHRHLHCVHPPPPPSATRSSPPSIPPLFTLPTLPTLLIPPLGALSLPPLPPLATVVPLAPPPLATPANNVTPSAEEVKRFDGQAYAFHVPLRRFDENGILVDNFNVEYSMVYYKEADRSATINVYSETGAQTYFINNEDIVMRTNPILLSPGKKELHSAVVRMFKTNLESYRDDNGDARLHKNAKIKFVDFNNPDYIGTVPIKDFFNGVDPSAPLNRFILDADDAVYRLRTQGTLKQLVADELIKNETASAVQRQLKIKHTITENEAPGKEAKRAAKEERKKKMKQQVNKDEQKQQQVDKSEPRRGGDDEGEESG